MPLACQKLLADLGSDCGDERGSDGSTQKLRSGKAAKKPSSISLSFDVDDAIVEARTAIDDGLIEHLNIRLQIFGEKGLVAADVSDGLLISVLKLIAANGKYPMEKGRFWQILDRYDPSSPFAPEDAIRARLSGEIELLFAAAENECFEDGFDSVLSLETAATRAEIRRHDPRRSLAICFRRTAWLLGWPQKPWVVSAK